jgi:glycosyltransferase involved in cell wall biosynthesis
MVRDGENGFVVEPEPKALAVAMTLLARDRERAKVMGQQGRRDIDSARWDRVSVRLLEALGFGSLASEGSRH